MCDFDEDGNVQQTQVMPLGEEGPRFSLARVSPAQQFRAAPAKQKQRLKKGKKPVKKKKKKNPKKKSSH
jgi:hypothetical protein